MMNGLFRRRPPAGLWQMLQQRLIRSGLERKTEGWWGGGVRFGGKLNHVSDCSVLYLSAYVSVWLSIRVDPFFM